MGRLQHLERLALGRSAFQDAHSGVEVRKDGSDTTGQQAMASSHHRYDLKGRPVNPATERHNQAVRNAQNAVLSLVGVVESTDAEARDLEQAARHVQLHRSKLLDAEQDRGDDVDLLEPLLHRIFTWWPEILLFRVQAGMFAGTMPMTAIVRSELQLSRLTGMRGLLHVLLRGFPIWLLLRTTKTLLCAGFGEILGRIQQTLNRRTSRKRMKQLNTLIRISCELIPIAIDVVFLPLQYLAMSQSLGLIAAWRPYSNGRLLLPWNLSPLHATIWKPTYGGTAFARLTSPAAIMLLTNFLEHDQGDGVPIGHQFTAFQWPAINAPENVIKRLEHEVHDDAFGRLLFRCYRVRARVMRWLGWNLEYGDEYPVQDKKYQNNLAVPSQPRSPHALGLRFRSTSLAHQPAQFISNRIDGLFTTVMMFPIYGLMLRTIAQSYLLSEWPKSRQAMEAAPHMYLPFGGGPLKVLRNWRLSRAAWHEAGVYVERLGLGLAIKCVGELAVFGLVYGFCRWQGVSAFEWGNARRSRERLSIDNGVDSIDELTDSHLAHLIERG